MMSKVTKRLVVCEKCGHEFKSAKENPRCGECGRYSVTPEETKDTQEEEKMIKPEKVEVTDDEIEKDEEVVELKKELRKAHLKRELAEIMKPFEIDEKMEELEEDVSALWKIVYKIPFKGLRERKCSSCGTKGLVAIKIRCTDCKEETWWEHFPKKT